MTAILIYAMILDNGFDDSFHDALSLHDILIDAMHLDLARATTFCDTLTNISSAEHQPMNSLASADANIVLRFMISS